MKNKTYILMGVMCCILVEDSLGSTSFRKNTAVNHCLEGNYEILENRNVHRETKQKKTNAFNMIKKLLDHDVMEPEFEHVIKGQTECISLLRKFSFGIKRRPKRSMMHQDKKRSTKVSLKRRNKNKTRGTHLNITARDVDADIAQNNSNDVTGIGDVHSLGSNSLGPFMISEHAFIDESATLISKKSTHTNDNLIIPGLSTSTTDNIMHIKDDDVKSFTLELQRKALLTITPESLLLVDAMAPSSVHKETGHEIKLEQATSKQIFNVLDNPLSKIWQVLIPQPRLSKKFTRKNILKASATSKPTVYTKRGKHVQNFSNSMETVFLSERKKQKFKRLNSKMYTESDYRPSAIGIGSFGALVLVIITVGIIILDIDTLYRDFKRLKRRIYSCCKPFYRSKRTMTLKENNGERWAYVIGEGQM